jgi:hypothetical protein
MFIWESTGLLNTSLWKQSVTGYQRMTRGLPTANLSAAQMTHLGEVHSKINSLRYIPVDDTKAIVGGLLSLFVGTTLYCWSQVSVVAKILLRQVVGMDKQQATAREVM